MKQKKGFTLIEIVGVIALIGMLCTTSYISLAKVSEAGINNSYNKTVETFYQAARVYVDNDPILRNQVYNEKERVTVKLETLKNEKLITGNIINPLTNQVFNHSSYVKIAPKEENDEFYLVKWGKNEK